MTALPNQTARKVRKVPEHVRYRFTEGVVTVRKASATPKAKQPEKIAPVAYAN